MNNKLAGALIALILAIVLAVAFWPTDRDSGLTDGRGNTLDLSK